MRLIPQAPQGKINVGLYLYVTFITLDVQKPRFLDMPAKLCGMHSNWYLIYTIRHPSSGLSAFNFSYEVHVF